MIEGKAKPPSGTEPPSNRTLAAKLRPEGLGRSPREAKEEKFLKQKKGDLFASGDSLAHCVSLDFRMGAGIALQFRKKFGRVDELRRQVSNSPGLGVLKDPAEGKTSRFIYYLVTKESFFQKPTYESLFASLELMKKHLLENSVKKLSIPCLGCGLDKLEWLKVELMLEKIFKDAGIEITVYTL